MITRPDAVAVTVAVVPFPSLRCQDHSAVTIACRDTAPERALQIGCAALLDTDKIAVTPWSGLYLVTTPDKQQVLTAIDPDITLSDGRTVPYACWEAGIYDEHNDTKRSA